MAVRLVLAVGVEVDLAGVAPLGHDHAGRHDAVDAEHLPDRLDHLRPAAGDDDDLPAGRPVFLDQVGGLGVHERVHDLVQRLAHDVLDRLGVPAGDHGGELRAQPLHLLGVDADAGEDELGVGRLQDGAAIDQPAVEERPAEGQGAGLGDDRLVQVEERRCAGHKARL